MEELEVAISCVARRVLEWYDAHENTLDTIRLWQDGEYIRFSGTGRIPVVGHAYVPETGPETSDLDRWLSGNFHVVGTLI